MNKKMLKQFWKKRKMAVLSWLAVFAIVLSGCGGKNPVGSMGESLGGTESPEADKSARGRYMESPKTTPEGLSKLASLVRLSDGSIGIVSEDTGMVYTSKDEGETWESKEVEALKDVLKDEEGYLSSLALAKDGGVFFSYIPSDGMDENGNVTELYTYVDASGQAREVSLQSDPSDFAVWKSVFGDDGNLYLGYYFGKVYRADLDTGKLESVMEVDGDIEVFSASGDYLICTASRDAVKIYRISTGEILEEDSVLDEFYNKGKDSESGMGILADEDGKLYTASRSGLYAHIPGGSVMDELLDGELCNMGDPTKGVASLLKGKDGGFLVAYSDGEIDSYIYDKDAPTVPEQQLTVYSLTKNDTVSKAVSAFRKNHPEVFVKQEIGITGEENMVAEDAIRNLNVSLLSGEGPDILILDGLPKDAYMEKGQLKDLSSFVEKLEGGDSYFHNILTTYENDGGIYALPTRFRIPVLIGEKQTIEKVKTLKDMADMVIAEREKYPERWTILGTFSPDELLTNLQGASAPAWIENGEFQKDAVLEYLTQLGRIYEVEHQNVTQGQEQIREEVATSSAFGMDYAQYQSFINASAAYNFLSQESSFVAGYLNSVASVKMLVSLMELMDTLDYVIMPGQVEHVFCPTGIVGVNADTKEEELSLEFLEELFGEEVLKNDLDEGYPVNQKAFDQFFVDPSGGTDNEGFAARTEDGEMVMFNIRWPKDEELAELKETIGNLTVPGDVERILKEAVFVTGEKVLRGEMTPQEGADEIGQKMELYFAE